MPGRRPLIVFGCGTFAGAVIAPACCCGMLTPGPEWCPLILWPDQENQLEAPTMLQGLGISPRLPLTALSPSIPVRGLSRCAVTLVCRHSVPRRHEREDDAGELVGGRHGDKLEGFGLHQTVRPASQRIGPAPTMGENSMHVPTTSSLRIIGCSSWRRAPAAPYRLKSSAAA